MADREQHQAGEVREHEPRVQLRHRSLHLPGTRDGDEDTPWSSREVSALRACRRLEVAALLLLALDRLEQRLEVADPEATRAVALDDLEEERRSVLHRSGEDLQEVALLVAVRFDAELLQGVDGHADISDTVRQRRVVLVRQPQELHAVLPEPTDRADDVLGPERDVLAAWRPIPIEVLLDLALLLARRGLVDRGI